MTDDALTTKAVLLLAGTVVLSLVGCSFEKSDGLADPALAVVSVTMGKYLYVGGEDPEVTVTNQSATGDIAWNDCSAEIQVAAGDSWVTANSGGCAYWDVPPRQKRLGPGESASKTVPHQPGYRQRVILDLYGSDGIRLPLEKRIGSEFETEVVFAE